MISLLLFAYAANIRLGVALRPVWTNFDTSALFSWASMFVSPCAISVTELMATWEWGQDLARALLAESMRVLTFPRSRNIQDFFEKHKKIQEIRDFTHKTRVAWQMPKILTPVSFC